MFYNLHSHLESGSFHLLNLLIIFIVTFSYLGFLTDAHCLVLLAAESQVSLNPIKYQAVKKSPVYDVFHRLFQKLFLEKTMPFSRSIKDFSSTYNFHSHS